MSLQDMARRARDREHPPSPERARAQAVQLGCGNAPWQTRTTEDEREDRCRYQTFGPDYRRELERKIKNE